MSFKAPGGSRGFCHHLAAFVVTRVNFLRVRKKNLFFSHVLLARGGAPCRVFTSYTVYHKTDIHHVPSPPLRHHLRRELINIDFTSPLLAVRWARTKAFSNRSQNEYFSWMPPGSEANDERNSSEKFNSSSILQCGSVSEPPPPYSSVRYSRSQCKLPLA